MRVLFLQDKLYYPTYGGGVKAIRMLLEGLSRRGHACASVGPMLASRAGPPTEAAFHANLQKRGVKAAQVAPGVVRYRLEGVDVDAHNLPARDDVAAHARRRIDEFEPDWVFVSDDRHGTLLGWALEAAPDRVVTLLQTVIHLPFGPYAYGANAEHRQRLSQVRAILSISRFLQDYLAEHGDLESIHVAAPVYGEGPFPLASPDARYVTLINPCVEKGLPIFLELARRFPSRPFAAVPTWGAEASVLETLRAVPNVTLLEPVDEIDEVLAQTRVLLAPSLWPETFGYVAPEAMLRGIPVLASNLGGLGEAKLGVDYSFSVEPARIVDGRYMSGPQDVEPWAGALNSLLTDVATFERVSRESREAALAYVQTARVERFEEILTRLPAAAGK